MVLLKPLFQKLPAIAHKVLLDLTLSELKGTSGIYQGILAGLTGTEPESEGDNDEANDEGQRIPSFRQATNPSDNLSVFHTRCLHGITFSLLRFLLMCILSSVLEPLQFEGVFVSGVIKDESPYHWPCL